MDSRPLGSTGVEVSALGFGCMGLIGWYGQRDDEEARATLLAAMEHGITHFDTASSYQQGENERFVGATLKSALQCGRERLFIASKFGLLRDPAGGVLLDVREKGSGVRQCASRLRRPRRRGRPIRTASVSARRPGRSFRKGQGRGAATKHHRRR